MRVSRYLEPDHTRLRAMGGTGRYDTELTKTLLLRHVAGWLVRCIENKWGKNGMNDQARGSTGVGIA